MIFPFFQRDLMRIRMHFANMVLPNIYLLTFAKTLKRKILTYGRHIKRKWFTYEQLHRLTNESLCVSQSRYVSRFYNFQLNESTWNNTAHSKTPKWGFKLLKWITFLQSFYHTYHVIFALFVMGHNDIFPNMLWRNRSIKYTRTAK